jgi:hypothetical protein
MVDQWTTSQQNILESNRRVQSKKIGIEQLLAILSLFSQEIEMVTIRQYGWEEQKRKRTSGGFIRISCFLKFLVKF